MPATPSSVRAEGIRFVEADGAAAGVYSASFDVPADAVLVDVIVHGTALWTAGTSAILIVGDAVDDDGIFTAVNLKATDLLAGESISLALSGGKYGADVAPNDATGGTLAAGAAGQVNRRKLAATRTLKAKVTTVGTAGTAGDTTVVFVYTYTAPIRASFA
jgi:hypothetical protein